jgi:hypothetical protein
VLAFSTFALVSSPSSPRPPGVAEENWLAISDSLGLIVGPPAKGAWVAGGVPRTSVRGQLMARVEGRWVMVEFAESESTLRILPAR